VDVVDIVEAHIVGVALLSWRDVFFIVVNLFTFFSRFNDFLKLKSPQYGKSLKNIENFPDFYTWVQVGSHQKNKDVSKFSFHKF
jgi:hypothetical protein